MKIQDKLVCPKCQTRSLRKAHGRNPVGEMFCDKDREYFTIWELVNIWGFDAGDFVNQKGVYVLTQEENQNFFEDNIFVIFPKQKTHRPTFIKFPDWFKSDTVSKRIDTLDMFEGEPMWKSNQEREEAYEMVHRMFDGIPEYDDYQDLKNTQECALYRGVQ